jgi:iron complex outermembrane receptor protein
MNALLAVLLCLQGDPETEEAAPPEDQEVVVIAQRRKGDILDVPSSVTVVTSEQIQESGASDVAEVIRRQAGFFAQGANAGAHDKIVDLRGYNNGGGNGQRTLVLVDGRKTNSVDSSTTDWASIPLSNVERIEIVRGPAAAIYGDAALAGVINIITRKGGKKGYGRIANSVGNWGTFGTAFDAGGRVEGVAYSFHAGAEQISGWRDHSRYFGRNATGWFKVPLGEVTSWSFKLGHHQDSRERPGTLSKAEVEAFSRKAAVNTGDHRGRADYVDSGLTHSLEDLGELSLFVNHTRSEGRTVFNDPFGDYVIDDTADISMLQLKHTVDPVILTLPTTFTSGMDFSYETADAESSWAGAPAVDHDYRRRLMGLYTHVEVRPMKPLIFSGSIRYDRALLDVDLDDPSPFGTSYDRKRDFDQLSPYAGVTFRATPELSVYASAARTFKYPTRDELVGFTSSVPDLDPERARVQEVGARYRSPRWGSAGVTYYHMVVKDEIFFDPSVPVMPPFWMGANANFEKVKHQGVETEVRFTPCPFVDFFATHTFTRAIILESVNPAQEGKGYPVTPRLAGTLGATFRYEGAVLTLLGRYAGRRYLINDFENTAEPLGSYWSVDGKLSYRTGAFEIFISGTNLGDREYFDSGGLSFGAERFYPAQERSWYGGVTVRF